MNIVLDVGNSRIKWRRDDMAESFALTSLEDLDSQWQALQGAWSVTLTGSNVRGPKVAANIDAIAMRNFGCGVLWLGSQAEAVGVKNAYDSPAQLGVDRWAAIIAASQRVPGQACIVIDAGTAITVDAVDQHGQHHGGVIMPGLNLMLESLGRAAQLQCVGAEQREHLVQKSRALARSTDDAIMSGVVFSMRGGVRHVIEQQCKQINAKIQTIPIFVTGGDAHMLNFESLQMQCLPDLVLDGVVRLSEMSETSEIKVSRPAQ